MSSILTGRGDPASALAVGSFASADEAIDAILECTADVLQLKTVFLTRTDVRERVLRVVAVINKDPTFSLQSGLEFPLEATP